MTPKFLIYKIICKKCVSPFENRPSNVLRYTLGITKEAVNCHFCSNEIPALEACSVLVLGSENMSLKYGEKNIRTKVLFRGEK